MGWQIPCGITVIPLLLYGVFLIVLYGVFLIVLYGVLIQINLDFLVV